MCDPGFFIRRHSTDSSRLELTEVRRAKGKRVNVTKCFIDSSLAACQEQVVVIDSALFYCQFFFTFEW